MSKPHRKTEILQSISANLRLVFLIVGVLLFVFGISYFLTYLKSPPSSSSLSVLPLSPSPTKVSSDLFFVSRVIDGDTIELENGEKVRYIGIDTPETLDPRKPLQCFGKEASAKNKELVEGKQVRLEKDVTDKDKYGRLLRYVYLGDPDQELTVFVNLELVKQGFAHSYTYPPDVKHQSEFVAAEGEARDANRGLWSSCLSSEALRVRVSESRTSAQVPPGVAGFAGIISLSAFSVNTNTSARLLSATTRTFIPYSSTDS